MKTQRVAYVLWALPNASLQQRPVEKHRRILAPAQNGQGQSCF